MSEVLRNILDRLNGVHEQVNGYIALCPAHEDTNPSLSICEGKNGKVLLKCHAECDTKAICAAIGLKLSDLFESKATSNSSQIVATYDYEDRDAELLYQVVRYANKTFKLRRPDGDRGWSWNIKGVARVLYQLPELDAAGHDERILICEGEKDCDNLLDLGLVATTNAQGAGKWKTLSDDSILDGHPITIIADKDDPGRKHARDVAKRLDGRVPEIRILEVPGDGKDVSDWLQAGGTKDALIDLIETAPQFNADDSDDEVGDESESKQNEVDGSQATILVQLCSDIELFHDDEVAYAAVQVNNEMETFPVGGRKFKNWLRRRFFIKVGKTPRSQSLSDAIGVIDGKALFEGPEIRVFIRLVEHDGVIYLDLGDEQRYIVRIDKDGWSVIHNPPVRFRRPKAFKALPVPQRGGSLNLLRRFINIENDHDFVLLIAWLIAAFRPGYPFPILAFNSEHGSGKSTASRMLRSLIDPNSAPIRSEPREPRELMIAANNSWVVAFDNLSEVSTWRSDALCRLSTGGGFSARVLYENDEECIFDVMRPVIINGIEDLGTRSDLLDRVIRISLPTIPEDKRRPEDELYAEFEKARPLILGSICDAISRGLARIDHIRLERHPRMADFAKFIVAAEPALPWSDGEFMRSYGENRVGAHELALEASPVGDVICRFADSKGEWTGTASELLQFLDDMVEPSVRNVKGWPTRPHVLSGQLRRLAPNLRALGVELEFPNRRNRKRMLRVGKVAQNSVTSVTERHHLDSNITNAVSGDALTPEGDALVTLAASPEWPFALRHERCDAGDAGDAQIHPLSPRIQDAIDAAEERAAIMEFDGGLSRDEAERRNGLHHLNGEVAACR